MRDKHTVSPYSKFPVLASRMPAVVFHTRSFMKTSEEFTTHLQDIQKHQPPSIVIIFRRQEGI